MSRVLRGSSPTVTAAFIAGEDPENVGAVEVEVVDVLGEQLAAGPATIDGEDSTYSFQLPPSATADVARLTATWTAEGGQTVTTPVEVVGGRYGDVRALRRMPQMDNREKYPLPAVEAAMAAAEDKFQQATGVAWQPRFHLTEGEAGGVELDAGVLYVRRVLWARVDGVDVDTSGWLARPGGLIVASSAPRGRYVAVAVEHGREQVPADLREAWLLYVRTLLLDWYASKLPDRATTVTTDLGTFSINQAGKDRPTGVPDVDAVLALYDERVPSVA